MPELPEVETVKNSIKKDLVNQEFISLKIFWHKVIQNISFKNFKSQIINKKIINIYRRAKYIILEYNDFLVAIHLRMTGKLYMQDLNSKLPKHTSLVLKLKKKQLVFEDTRKFGRFYLFENKQYLDTKLGIEPLDAKFTNSWLIKNLKLKNRQIKSLLFDQSFIVGLGNIYIDESLWLSKIHPLTKSNEIPLANVKILRSSIVEVLKKSIKLGGTTIRDYTYDFSYVGNYSLNLNVYGKDGLNCNRCKNLIIKMKVAQRGTHICTKCQKK